MEFPLGLNPVSDDSIVVIGQARDLGHCTAVQRDGNRCKSWVDLWVMPQTSVDRLTFILGDRIRFANIMFMLLSGRTNRAEASSQLGMLDSIYRWELAWQTNCRHTVPILLH